MPASKLSARPFSLTLRNVSVDRADRPVLVDVDLTVTERSRIAVVGPNGVGKSTLLRVLAGRLRPDRGRIEAAPPDLTVGLLDQQPLTRSGSATVRELVAERLGAAEARRELEAASHGLADHAEAGADRYERALERYLAVGAADLDSRLEETVGRLGLPARLLDAQPDTLSGGEAERVGLAMVMVSRFDLTLLDEPTNNLDLDGLERLERWVDDHSAGLVLVSHDRAFLERTVSTVVEIDHHHHTIARFEGGWQAYRDERERAAALAQERYGGYTAERDRLRARSQRQREWAAKGASRARKNPADGDKLRRNWNLAQTEKLVAKARASDKALERLEVVDKPWEPWELRFTIERAPRSAKVVAALDGAVFRRGGFSLGPIDLEIHWADRLALVGPNGSGKSTLLAGLLGRLSPSHGRASLGPGVVVGELDQDRDGLAGEAGGEGPQRGATRSRSTLRAFQDATDLEVAEARSLLAKFGLDAEAVSRPPSSLSPGERTRAQLALFQARGVNLLVLDEPTNHLDIDAIEQLESALGGYDGTLIVVSHDRRLLENLHFTATVDLRDHDHGPDIPKRG